MSDLVLEAFLQSKVEVLVGKNNAEYIAEVFCKLPEAVTKGLGENASKAVVKQTCESVLMEVLSGLQNNMLVVPTERQRQGEIFKFLIKYAKDTLTVKEKVNGRYELTKRYQVFKQIVIDMLNTEIGSEAMLAFVVANSEIGWAELMSVMVYHNYPRLIKKIAHDEQRIQEMMVQVVQFGHDYLREGLFYILLQANSMARFQLENKDCGQMRLPDYRDMFQNLYDLGFIPKIEYILITHYIIAKPSFDALFGGQRATALQLSTDQQLMCYEFLLAMYDQYFNSHFRQIGKYLLSNMDLFASEAHKIELSRLFFQHDYLVRQQELNVLGDYFTHQLLMAVMGKDCQLVAPVVIEKLICKYMRSCSMIIPRDFDQLGTIVDKARYNRIKRLMVLVTQVRKEHELAKEAQPPVGVASNVSNATNATVVRSKKRKLDVC